VTARVTTEPPATVHVVGRGIVGSRIHRMLRARSVVLHDGRWPDVGGTVAGDVVVLAHGGRVAVQARDLMGRGLHVVTMGDSLNDTRTLLEAAPHREDVSLVVGASMSPGLSGLIARYLADQLASADEIHIAVHGTAGPACARVHHRSLSGLSPSYRDGVWVDYVGGSGRELCWFPEPIGAKDCYRASTSSPYVLQRSFPDAGRISARRSARRRDRLTAWLPMLRPPHHEGGVGGVRVEVRGADAGGGRQVLIAGVAELVGTAAAATASSFATAILDGRLPTGVVVAGDASLPTLDLLRRVEGLGVRLQEFTGIPQR
jgi:hypothetical protein